MYSVLSTRFSSSFSVFFNEKQEKTTVTYEHSNSFLDCWNMPFSPENFLTKCISITHTGPSNLGQAPGVSMTWRVGETRQDLGERRGNCRCHLAIQSHLGKRLLSPAPTRGLSQQVTWLAQTLAVLSSGKCTRAGSEAHVLLPWRILREARAWRCASDTEADGAWV